MAKKKINKKKQKRAFTLIELLAVIVILAIIALIAVPIVMNLLNKSRQKSAENSAYSYLKATEYYIGLSELELEPKRLEAGKCYNVNNSTIIEEEAIQGLNELVDIKGSKPTGLEDHLCFDEKYTVKEGILTINGYTIEIKNGHVVNSVKGAKINVKDFTLNVSSEISMERNTTLTIKANSFDPANASNQKLLFESKNEDIITVTNDGLVTALKNGEGTIVVTSEDNNKIKKEIKITVVSPQDITEIEISKEVTDEELYVGQYINLIATIKPSDAVVNSLTWASDNEDVATVENGRVFGKSLGTAKITATSKKGVVAEIEITVKEVLAESITISGSSYVKTNEYNQLSVTILPENTTNKNVKWTSSDESVATVDENGNVKGVSQGKANIIAETSNGKTSSFEIINGYKEFTTGTTENTTVIYYNPVTNAVCDEETYLSNTNASKTGNVSGCMKWYSIENSDYTKSTVKLMLDHNTTTYVKWLSKDDFISSGGSSTTWSTYSGLNVYGPVTLMNKLKSDTSSWHTSIKSSVTVISMEEIGNIIGLPFSNDNYSSDIYLENHSTTAPQAYNGSYSWLIDNMYNVTNNGGVAEDNNSYTPLNGTGSWTLKGYWTITPHDEGTCSKGCGDEAYSISNYGYVSNDEFIALSSTPPGIRPVITISKDILNVK